MPEGTQSKMVTVKLEGNDVVVRFHAMDREGACALATAVVQMVQEGNLVVTFLEQNPTAPSTDTRQ